MAQLSANSQNLDRTNSNASLEIVRHDSNPYHIDHIMSIFANIYLFLLYEYYYKKSSWPRKCTQDRKSNFI